MSSAQLYATNCAAASKYFEQPVFKRFEFKEQLYQYLANFKGFWLDLFAKESKPILTSLKELRLGKTKLLCYTRKLIYHWQHSDGTSQVFGEEFTCLIYLFPGTKLKNVCSDTKFSLFLTQCVFRFSKLVDI